MNLVGAKAKKACEHKVNTIVKNKVLTKYAQLLEKEKKLILKQNLKDIGYARKIGLKDNLINRLLINETKLKDIQNSIIKLNRQFLHAKTLGFIHPRTRKEMIFSSLLPQDLNKILKMLRNTK